MQGKREVENENGSRNTLSGKSQKRNFCCDRKGRRRRREVKEKSGKGKKKVLTRIIRSDM